MILALWFAISALAAILAGSVIRVGMVDKKEAP